MGKERPHDVHDSLPSRVTCRIINRAGVETYVVSHKRRKGNYAIRFIGYLREMRFPCCERTAGGCSGRLYFFRIAS